MKTEKFDHTTPHQSEDLKRRFASHSTTEQQNAVMETNRHKALALAAWVEHTAPPSRERSLAITHLEEAVFWANAAVERPQVAPKGRT